MRKILLSCIVFLFLSFSVSTEALESRCFTEYARIDIPSSSPQFLSTEYSGGDIFFVQDSEVLPARTKSIIQRNSYNYTLTSSIVLLNTEALIDDIATNNIEIQPTSAPNGLTLTLDFPVMMRRGEFVPNVDISHQGVTTISISTDGVSYVPVSLARLSEYDFSSLRIVLSRSNTPAATIVLRTLRFDKKQENIYIVIGKNNIPMEVYAGWICDSTKISTLRSSQKILSESIDTTVEPKNIVPVKLSPLPTTGRDSDGDGIIDMRDNCSMIDNRDQSDRNYDGVGDACSDDDRDSLRGASDNCPTVSNPDQRDLNNNNIGDACEFDSDSDTVGDGIDNCIRLANPDQKDTDKDGVGDMCDNCSLYNPNQLDLDTSGRGDLCEAVEEEKINNDKDGDGVIDSLDNCIRLANPDQKDTDKDGVGDTCDNCMTIQNRDQADTNKNSIGEMCEDIDNDGIDGWRDNCPSIANSDQADRDNNMVGDVCTDTDNDTIYDSVDNCPLIYNQDQKNIDNDTIGDVCDDTDNRFIESNKTFFMVLFASISLLFIGAIIFFLRKITL